MSQYSRQDFQRWGSLSNLPGAFNDCAVQYFHFTPSSLQIVHNQKVDRFHMHSHIMLPVERESVNTGLDWTGILE